MSIQYLKGDATRPAVEGPTIIAHVCNDIGGWGKGFVTAVSKRWTAPETTYRRWYSDKGRFELGMVQLVVVGKDAWVANMIAQHGLRATEAGPPIRYDALRECLEKVAAEAEAAQASVHMPRIGCGLAGGTWEEVEPIIAQTLGAKDVPVYVYDL